MLRKTQCNAWKQYSKANPPVRITFNVGYDDKTNLFGILNSSDRFGHWCYRFYCPLRRFTMGIEHKLFTTPEDLFLKIKNGPEKVAFIWDFGNGLSPEVWSERDDMIEVMLRLDMVDYDPTPMDTPLG